MLVGAAAVLAACVACGQPEEIGFGGAPPPVTTAPASEPDEQPTQLPPGGADLAPQPPAGVDAIDSAKVDASALPEGYPNIVWTEDPSTIGAYVQAGGCIEASAEAGEQSADKVVLKLVETHSGAQMCTMDLQFPPVAVTLDAPLGDRTVVLERVQVGPK